MKRFLAAKPTVIVAHGDKPPVHFLRSIISRAQTVIALDGAAHWLVEHGLNTDLVIGDFDSARRPLLGDLKILKVDDQNSNDLEKALDYCKTIGLSEITVTGAFGKRVDHFLTNVFVMRKYAHSLTISLVDDTQCAFICPKKQEIIFENAVSAFISLFPLGNEVGPIWSLGVKYPLTNEMLSLRTRVGTLNQVTEKKASIYCESDDLLVTVPNFST